MYKFPKHSLQYKLDDEYMTPFYALNGLFEYIKIDKNTKIKIDKISNRVSEAKVFNKNGTITSYKITQFKANLPVKDAYFKFDKRTKPGVVEVDLR